jgi:hypothetical protein
MNSKKAKVLLNQGRSIYADLINGDRNRIIRIGSKYCQTLSGRKINLSNVLDFN